MPEDMKISQLSAQGFIPMAAVVAIITVFGFWWNTADPRIRLDRIEQTAVDLSREIAKTYVTLLAHKDLQDRILTQMSDLQRKDEDLRNTLLTKAQFEAWKLERDAFLATIIKNVDAIEVKL